MRQEVPNSDKILTCSGKTISDLKVISCKILANLI